MIVTHPKAMRGHKLNLLVLLLVAALLLLIIPNVLADEADPRRVHVIDTNTDRTPAITAFPAYPKIARRDRIEGDATVCFMIDKRGRISKARIKDASHRIFRRAALRAIRASTFKPLAPNEILATARTCRTYRFRLEPVALARTRIPE